MNYLEAIIPLSAGLWLLFVSRLPDKTRPPEEFESADGTPQQRKFARIGWVLIGCAALYCVSISLTARAQSAKVWSVLEQPGRFSVEMPDNRSEEKDKIDLGWGEVESTKWKAHGPSGELLIRYADLPAAKVSQHGLATAVSIMSGKLKSDNWNITHSEIRSVHGCPGAIIDAAAFNNRAKVMIVVTSNRAYVLLQTSHGVEVDGRFFDSFNVIAK